MPRKCVVSFADEGRDYQKKMKRLEVSLRYNFDGDFLGFTSYKEINCEHHKVIPYKFKAMAIQKAIDLGYDYILWCDSPIVATQSIEPVFDHIKRRGYVFFDNIGHPLGKWTNDKCLEYFNMTREESQIVKMIMACCMGFRMDSLSSAEFLHDYVALANELYPGSWDNHRHDQTVASFLINELGMEIIQGHKTYFAYEQFYQVPELQPIADSVCLVSKG